MVNIEGKTPFATHPKNYLTSPIPYAVCRGCLLGKLLIFNFINKVSERDAYWLERAVLSLIPIITGQINEWW